MDDDRPCLYKGFSELYNQVIHFFDQSTLKVIKQLHLYIIPVFSLIATVRLNQLYCSHPQYCLTKIVLSTKKYLTNIFTLALILFRNNNYFSAQYFIRLYKEECSSLC